MEKTQPQFTFPMQWRAAPNRVGTKPKDQLTWALKIAYLKLAITGGDKQTSSSRYSNLQTNGYSGEKY